ncbi:hypothetical protein DP113_29720 [Brasilonema octagenarum UFV-E1]|uniref:Uncharacterized protein n=1 Tax=Brasilonema sennae CENA114 TaxID=415709 RepID=A0A856MJJ4_9CYAN|nr:hypothetical protein [Brasilonema sennae]QDL11493.1 hypothetical protein DP114_29560 [Brasilonema sennae CENA114]QDL17876.1 hypothetical protein DP113_29720 [Brasilonema octagenarum UFV-E1]
MTRRIAWYGTAAVIVHTIVNILHALTHVSIPVPVTPSQAVFIVTVILTVPLVAMVLLWTPLSRMGVVLLLVSMLGSLIFGVYNHFIAISPDHISQIPPGNWQLLFQVTAVLLFLTELLGCGVGVWAIQKLRDEERIA